MVLEGWKTNDGEGQRAVGLLSGALFLSRSHLVTKFAS